MQVFLVNRSALQPLQSGPSQPEAEAPRGFSAPQDSVQLSDASRELAGKGEETNKVTSELSDEDKEKVQELKSRDREVRTHEQAHIAASGGHAKGQPTYEYETGPDGQQYAVGGHVDIDTSPVPDDPKATAEKMRVVRRAALAPAEPSTQDRKVAAEASSEEQKALRELAEQERSGETDSVSGGPKPAGEQTGVEPGVAPSPGAAERPEAPSPDRPEVAREEGVREGKQAQERRPNPKAAFAFDALRQALAIR